MATSASVGQTLLRRSGSRGPLCQAQPITAEGALTALPLHAVDVGPDRPDGYVRYEAPGQLIGCLLLNTADR
ncbi:hypothetical protein [Streptomyces roseus]